MPLIVVCGSQPTIHPLLAEYSLKRTDTSVYHQRMLPFTGGWRRWFWLTHIRWRRRRRRNINGCVRFSHQPQRKNPSATLVMAKRRKWRWEAPNTCFQYNNIVICDKNRRPQSDYQECRILFLSVLKDHHITSHWAIHWSWAPANRSRKELPGEFENL